MGGALLAHGRPGCGADRDAGSHGLRDGGRHAVPGHIILLHQTGGHGTCQEGDGTLIYGTGGARGAGGRDPPCGGQEGHGPRHGAGVLRLRRLHMHGAREVHGGKRASQRGCGLPQMRQKTHERCRMPVQARRGPGMGGGVVHGAGGSPPRIQAGRGGGGDHPRLRSQQGAQDTLGGHGLKGPCCP